MGKVPAFDEKELEVVREEPNFFGGTDPIYSYPVTMKEAVRSALSDKKPYWMMMGNEQVTFTPSVIPDNGARGFVFEGEPYPREKFGGKDMFGIDWVYVDVAGGSMVKPGDPYLKEIDEWRTKLVWPDIYSWDWDGSAKMNEQYLGTDKSNQIILLNGCWFERLISFMDFQYAAMALVDEDDVEEVKELTAKLTDLYIDLVDVICDTYKTLDGIQIHDDWGSQKAPFFSEDVALDVYLPEMKRFVSHVHSKGKYCTLHSCGHNETRCDVFADAGFDAWDPMPMNDTYSLYDDYGDRLGIGVAIKKPEDLEHYDEAAQRAYAKECVDRLTDEGKLGYYSSFYSDPEVMTPAFREELYKQSRIRYSELY